MFEQLDSSWILYGALALLPVTVGLAGSTLSVVRKYKTQTLATLGVASVVAGGGVAAYEHDHDGDIPSSFEEIRQIPASVGSVVSRSVSNVAGTVGVEVPSPVPTPEPEWLPVSGQRPHPAIDLASGSVTFLIQCYHKSSVRYEEPSFFYPDGRLRSDRLEDVSVSESDAKNRDAWSRACAKLG